MASHGLTWDDYYRCLDSLGRFYNSEFIAHIGYQVATFGLAVALSPTIISIIADTIVFFYSAIPKVYATWIAAVIYAVLFLVWFTGCFRYSFRYLHGRSQYYAAISEIIWDHMGMLAESTGKRTTELRDRLFGMGQWSERKALGMPEGIRVLFEAYLYFSRCKKLGLGNEIAAHFDPFHVNEELCPIKGNEYYSGQKSLLWDKTDLLLLAYTPALNHYQSLEEQHRGKSPSEVSVSMREAIERGKLLRPDC